MVDGSPPRVEAEGINFRGVWRHQARRALGHASDCWMPSMLWKLAVVSENCPISKENGTVTAMDSTRSGLSRPCCYLCPSVHVYKVHAWHGRRNYPAADGRNDVYPAREPGLPAEPSPVIVGLLQDLVDVNSITSNDVGAILATLGVEAARATVVAEVVKVGAVCL